MKKYSISAVLFAMSLFGCSESGVDNSVASISSEDQSTYKIKLDENPNFLAKASVGKCEDYANFGCDETINVGGVNYHYAFTTNISAQNEGYSVLSLNVNNSGYAIPDYVHVYTVCVRGCDQLGYCQEHTSIATNNLTNYRVGSTPKEFLYTTCSPMPGDRYGISVISTFAAVFNAGKSNQFILQMSAHSSNLNQNQALLAYRHYMMNLD